MIRSFTVRHNATKPFPLADGNKIKEPDAAGYVSWRRKNQVQPSNQGRDDIQGWLPHTASSLAPRTQELMRTIDQTGNHESAEPEASGKLSAEPAEKMSSSQNKEEAELTNFSKPRASDVIFVFVIRMPESTKQLSLPAAAATILKGLKGIPPSWPSLSSSKSYPSFSVGACGYRPKLLPTSNNSHFQTFFFFPPVCRADPERWLEL